VGRRQKYDQLCPLATALDVVGSRWALLAVRELMLGPRRFSELEVGLETATPDMVTSRLRELEAEGVVTRRPDRRYELTRSGFGLAPVLVALGAWALNDHRPLGSGSGVEFDGPRRLMTNLALAGRVTRPGLDVRVGERHLLIAGGLRVAAVASADHWELTAVTGPDCEAAVVGEAHFADDSLLDMTIAHVRPASLIESGSLSVTDPQTLDLLMDIARHLATPVHRAAL